MELAFSNPVNDTLVDIDNIHLTNEAGHDLISNGDFSQGHDRWYFTTDDAVPWRIENIWLQVFFEQGLLGLTAFILFSLYALLRILKEIQAGRSGAQMLLASLVGFFTVGLFGSVLESPRLMMLFYLVVFMLLLSSKSGVSWSFQGNERPARILRQP